MNKFQAPNVSKTMFQQNLRHIPRLTMESWLLMIAGDVQQPLTLNYNKLNDLPTKLAHSVLMCSGHTPCNPMITEATWEGVPLQLLLDQVKPDADTGYLNFHSADGYATSISLSQANNAILAYRLNDTPLTPEYGFPIRLIIPGKAGYKLPKWIQHIIISKEPVQGYWEQHGWSSDGSILPISMINALKKSHPIQQTITLSGFAYGGSQPLDKIEISINHEQWSPIAFNNISNNHLTQWQTEWTPSVPGNFLIRVRAINLNGEIQPDSTQPIIKIQVTL